MFEIIRFKFDGDSEVVKTVETEAEAKEWCSRPDTKGDGWFDGFQEV